MVFSVSKHCFEDKDVLIGQFLIARNAHGFSIHKGPMGEALADLLTT